MKLRDEHIGFLFTLPAFSIMILLTFYPILHTLYLSFNEMSRETGFRMVFIGLENFFKVFNDSLYRTAFINTLLFVLGATALEVALGLLLALVLSTEFRGKKYVTGLILLPMMLPTVVICSFWRIMYHTELGIINAMLRLLGFGPVNWLGSPSLAMLSLIIVDLWQYTPFTFIILYAGINSIPTSLLEAAQIDGATSLQLLKHIVLPLIKKYILIVAMLRIIDTFRIFDKVFALTGGGPGNATETLSFVIYKNAFRYYNFGYAAAEAVLMLVAVLMIISVYIKILRGGSQ